MKKGLFVLMILFFGMMLLSNGTAQVTIEKGLSGSLSPEADVTICEEGYVIFGSQLKGRAAPVERTGQTRCYNASGHIIPCAGTGQDGDLQEGSVWPDTRFTDNYDGTVTDHLTGLVWLKNAGCDGAKTWTQALTFCKGLSHGICGLSDGSVAGQWRLPSIKELLSLIDRGQNNPALPINNPFSGALSAFYWSSTTYTYYTNNAWGVYIYSGFVNYYDKVISFNVWPVRSDN